MDLEDRKKEARVQFSEETDDFGHDSEIVVMASGPGSGLTVDLGFLQMSHRYQVQLELPLPSSLLSGPLAVRHQEPPNINLRVLHLSLLSHSSTSSSSSPSDAPFGHLGHEHVGDDTINRYNLIMELFAHKEKLLKELVTLESCTNPTQSVTFQVKARVLGQGKGTPLLKTGIKCIGVQIEDDSEQSDYSQET